MFISSMLDVEAILFDNPFISSTDAIVAKSYCIDMEQIWLTCFLINLLSIRNPSNN